MAKYVDSAFFSIELSTLKPDQPLPFVVYLLLPLNQHIIALRAVGDFPESEFLERLQSKSVTQVYLSIKDRKLYEDYLRGVAGIDAEPKLDLKATPNLSAQEPNIQSPESLQLEPSEPAALEVSENLSDPEASPAVEAAATATAAATIQPEPPVPPEVPAPSPEMLKAQATEVMKKLVSPDVNEQKKGAEQGRKMVEEIMLNPPQVDEELVELLQNPSAEHSANVSIYSVLFSVGLDITDVVLLQDIATAGLLHDLGLSQLSPSIAVIPSLQRRGAERESYEGHVRLGLELMKEINYLVSPRVYEILSQHHEKFDGSGFPDQMSGFKISEYAQVVGLADLLDTISKGLYDGVKRSFGESLAVTAKIEKKTSFPVYLNPDIYRKIFNWLQHGVKSEHFQVATQIVAKDKSTSGFLKAISAFTEKLKNLFGS